MRTSIRLASRNIGVTTAMLLSVALASHAQAAPAPGKVAADTLVEYVQQRDEIRVRGRVQSEDIAAAEDDFFRLYNELNSNDQYDVNCGAMVLDAESMMMDRKCEPRFIDGLSRKSTGFELDVINTGDFGDATPSIVFGGSYARRVGPQPSMLLLRKRDDYATNFNQIVNGDQRLQEKKEGSRGPL
jgi:hypothetical protein